MTFLGQTSYLKKTPFLPLKAMKSPLNHHKNPSKLIATPMNSPFLVASLDCPRRICPEFLIEWIALLTSMEIVPNNAHYYYSLLFNNNQYHHYCVWFMPPFLMIGSVIIVST